MKRFSPKVAAGALVGLAGLYLVLSLALGRSARSEPPVDLAATAADLGLDVWKAAAFIVQAERPAVIDVRPTEAFERYRLPLATSLPGASAEQLKALAADRPWILVYAGKDDVAQKLVAEARTVAPWAHIHYLVDGARAWYLAFALPVPLFAEAGPPSGYPEALAAATAWFAAPAGGATTAVTEALQTLARLNYQPSLLKAGKKAAPAGAKKKIGGGCG